MIVWKPRHNGEALLDRVRKEYVELPTLNLTFAQACRLWQMAPDECQHVLDRLIADGVLRRTAEGLFVSNERQLADVA